jgi:hypothetical protein
MHISRSLKITKKKYGGPEEMERRLRQLPPALLDNSGLPPRPRGNLCRDLCRNPLIPARVGRCRVLSLG